MLVSVNIGVLLSEKLLPTQGLGLVFTERSESEEEEGDTQTHTHAHTQEERPQMLTQSHISTDIYTHTSTNVDEVAE